MAIRSSRSLLLVGAVAALMMAMLPAASARPAPATVGIDDASGNPAVPGINVIRSVDSDGTVVVRLTRGGRNAHFNVIVRGVSAVEVDDDFPRAGGVDGGHRDGVTGNCMDELRTDFGRRLRKRGLVAMAKLYTCNQHDSIRIHLGEPKIGRGTYPAIKIVFTQGVRDNTAGVFVGNDPTDVGNSWIPLWRRP